MELNEYQKRAMGTAVFKNRYSSASVAEAAKATGIKLETAEVFLKELFGDYPFDLVYCVLALCGEAGELANKLKKSLRAGTDVNPAELMDENGDVGWYQNAISSVLGYTAEQTAQFNLDKLKKRYEETKRVNL